jgi:uncharacterized protein (TIGR02145 family)
MIPRKQIGWSQEENLLWEISKQLDKTITTLHTTGIATTTTTTTADPCPDCVQGTVNINGQIWDKCNLNVTTYNDNYPILEVQDPTEWAGLTIGAWCHFDNNPLNEPIYGKLYNGYAVLGIYDEASALNPALRKQLAPIGKRIPTDSEWTNLRTFLGGGAVAGGKLKQQGLCHWDFPNLGATDDYGFSSLAGGNRSSNGLFGGFKLVNNFWTPTVQSGDLLFNYYTEYLTTRLERSFGISKFGFSVRCLND